MEGGVGPQGREQLSVERRVVAGSMTLREWLFARIGACREDVCTERGAERKDVKTERGMALRA